MDRKYVISTVFLLVAGAGLVFAVARRAPVPAQTGKMEVVASFYPLAFFSGEIGGDQAAVTNITPAGAEPHDYEPTGADMARIVRSRLLILNGAGFEAWGTRVSGALNPVETTVVSVSDGIATVADIPEQGKMMTDPHVWLSPLLAQKITDNILAGFIKVDPLHRADYETNAALLKTRLANLDRHYRDGLAACEQKNIVTSHAAFGYLAASYGLRQMSIAGMSPDAEPSVVDLARIAEFAKKNNIRTIFFETLASPKLSETIAREIGAQTLVLNPIEGLTGGEISRGVNYFTVMQDNLKNLQIALICKL